MAKVTSVNLLPTSGSDAIFLLKEVLVLAGWVVPSSSDGTTYNAAGDQITHSGSGANGLANSNAWFRLRSPAGREYTYQRDTIYHYQWRIKYSALDQFVGGSPDAIETPSASDEQIIIGTGTDASPTHHSFFDSAAGSFRWHIIAQDAATGPAGNEVYGFWAFATEVSTGDLETVLMQEPTDPGSYPALVGTRAAPITGDPDPVIIIFQHSGSKGHMRHTQGTSRGWSDQVVSSNSKRYWFQYNNTNEGAEAFVGGQGGMWIGDNSPAAAHMPGHMGANPYDNSEEGFGFLFGRPGLGYTTQVGSKGIPAFIRVKAVNREYPSVINLNTDAYIYLEDSLVPWEDGTLPLV